MKRDMDMIRDIMIYLEDNLTPGKDISSSNIPLYKTDSDDSYREFSEHIRLLLEDGYIESIDPMSRGGITLYIITRITSKGHDFLSALRDDSTWKSVKENAMKAGGFTVSVLVDLGKTYIQSKLGL